MFSLIWLLLCSCGIVWRMVLILVGKVGLFVLGDWMGVGVVVGFVVLVCVVCLRVGFLVLVMGVGVGVGVEVGIVGCVGVVLVWVCLVVVLVLWWDRLLYWL